MFEALSCKRTMIARGIFFIKNFPIQRPFEAHKVGLSFIGYVGIAKFLPFL